MLLFLNLDFLRLTTAKCFSIFLWTSPAMFNYDLEYQNASNSDITFSLRHSTYQGELNQIRSSLHLNFWGKVQHSPWSSLVWSDHTHGQQCSAPFLSSILVVQGQKKHTWIFIMLSAFNFTSSCLYNKPFTDRNIFAVPLIHLNMSSWWFC